MTEPATSRPRRKIWGWGLEGEGLGDAERAALAATLAKRHGVAELKPQRRPPRVAEVELPAPRLEPPATLAERFTAEPTERLLHAYGKSYPDTVRALRGEFPDPPDLVAYPRDESDVVAILDWAGERNAAVVPFGGGSSVCGGVEPAVGGSYAGTISLDLRELDRLLEVDRASRAARFQAGIRGPALEAALKPHGLTLRHFPQSFEHSTLGGWIATRSGGHYATLYTHIDDLVESLRAVTPAGVFESRRLPGSGAGPSPDRMLIGSEGILGVITEAWMRLQDRPRFRASAAVRFDDFLAGATAVRALSQSGLFPTNCRLIDAQEAAGTGAGDGESALLVLGFESADHPLEPWMARALELARDHGGTVHVAEGEAGHREGAAGAWRDAFLRAPYLREAMVPLGVIADTFETAITWDRFAALHTGIVERMSAVLREVTGRPGTVTCRFTHVYPDGPAPYFTFQALGSWDGLLEQWRQIKVAANEAVIDLGGTITHHHAVGRDHRPGWERQRPPLFAAALRAAKHALDPHGVLNPGVLIDPQEREVGVTGALGSDVPSRTSPPG
ncbi:MAG TPA: FAD-binding oxidoreductase [Thermoanaerobaculia bacterium]|nr:FAD-binding oxidoreductase [Thermoanaerobaculia bacterium]